MENLEVKNIIISKQGEESENLKKFYEIVNRKKINVIVAKKGDRIKIDKFSYFDILFPEEEMINENILNNNSIVAKFNYLNFSMLFTGDVEEIAENKLYELYKNDESLKATVLKVAHHGSKTSSTEQFLSLVEPKIALIGVGENNNFGHPNKEVLERLYNMKVAVFRTDQMGEISIVVNRKGRIKIKTNL